MGRPVSASLAAGGVAVRWNVAAASVRGTSHAAHGQPCQDANAWAVAGGLLLAAVADGAGTAPLAEHGATAAVAAAVQSLRGSVDSGQVSDAASACRAIRDAFAAALAAVEAEAAARDADLRNLATTLGVVVAAPEWITAAQVGDAAVVVDDGSGALRTVGGVAGSEYLNETVFLTSPGVLDELAPAVREGTHRHLALMSDGLQMLALRIPGREPHLPFFEPLFRFVDAQPDAAAAGERLAAFLAGPRVAARADDDLTLILTALNPSESETP
jgi:hypothetical protein